MFWSLSGFPTLKFCEYDLQVVSFAILIGLLCFLENCVTIQMLYFCPHPTSEKLMHFFKSVENSGGCYVIAFRESKKAKKSEE